MSRLFHKFKRFVDNDSPAEVTIREHHNIVKDDSEYYEITLDGIEFCDLCGSEGHVLEKCPEIVREVNTGKVFRLNEDGTFR